MRRWFPEDGTLYERVRRPSMMALIGTLLMVPALALVPGSGPEREEASAAVHTEDAEGDEPETTIAQAEPVDGLASAAWRERALEREGERASEEFARRYRIPATLAREIYTAAAREGLDPQVGFGLVQTESSFRRTVVSYAGAVGYTQLLPSTARYMEPGTTRSELFDTRTNLRIGFKYLNYLLDKYSGDMRLALTAYNRGPGTVNRLLKQGRNPENGYATKVLRHVG